MNKRNMLRRTATKVSSLLGSADSQDHAIQTLESEKQQLTTALSKSVQETFRRSIRSMSSDSWMQVDFNGVYVDLPRDTLRTMYHCVSLCGEHALQLRVETAHLEWMIANIASGSTFIDVGCATGATTLPIAKHFGGKIDVLAYEPARAARTLLVATLERNGLKNVSVRPFAVSDSVGSSRFCEYLPDPTDATPWLVEASSLDHEVKSDRPDHEVYVVEVVSLDKDALPSCNTGSVVVKIDVEGFELCVLQGAIDLIKRKQPPFSIDIHTDPHDARQTTEQAVRSFLETYHYSFTNLGHVLLCSPPSH